jgi:NADH-quinone oxidoreductase subunit N
MDLQPISIDLASLNLNSLTPMLVAIVGALVILVLDLAKENLSKAFYTMITVIFLVMDLSAVVGYSGADRGFFDVMLMDGLAIVSQVIMIVASIVLIPLSMSSSRFHEYRYPEFFALFLFMIAGFQFMVSSDNLILIFVGLETASLALYAMIAMHNRDRSFEAAIKYFTMGAMAAGFFAFGSLILYALTGSVELYQISEKLIETGFEPLPLVMLATAFMLASFGFKLSLMPFHTWTPDVYEGSSAALAGYMAIVPKMAGFVVAMRLFEFYVVSGVEWIQTLLYVIVVVTMTGANTMALIQKDVKRMLAFSSISHAGFVMAAILIGTTQANSALFLYWVLFMFTNIGAFTMLWISRHKSQRWHTRFDHPYEKFAGMIKIMPFAATIMGLFMIALAGVPPFSVFWGKMYMLSAVVNEGFIILALIMALNSAIAAYYYLKLVVYMFFHEPSENEGTTYVKNASMQLKTILGISAVFTTFAFLFIDTILASITSLVQVSGF